MQGRAADKGDRKRGKGVSACTARESHACTDSSSSCTGPRQSQSWEGRGREKQLEGESAGARDSDVPQSGPSSSPSTRPTHPADDSRGVGTTAGPLPPTRDPPSPLPGCSSRARRPPPPSRASPGSPQLERPRLWPFAASQGHRLSHTSPLGSRIDRTRATARPSGALSSSFAPLLAVVESPSAGLRRCSTLTPGPRLAPFCVCRLSRLFPAEHSRHHHKPAPTLLPSSPLCVMADLQ